MAKRRKKSKPLRALPVDLSVLAGAPIEAIEANVAVATATALSVFDSRTQANYVASGRAVAPMGTVVETSKDGVTIRHMVSARPISISDLSVSPSLVVPTTGRDRKRVTVEGKRGRVIEVPRGFIWNFSIFMRRETGRKIDNAKAWLVHAGADPSPAAMLGDAAPDVIAAETDRLLHGLGEVEDAD